MALKNKSMYAILGILSVGPGTGYDIKKYCDTVLPGIWNENFGHIYPTLKMLTEQGLITPVEETRTPGKIAYSITQKGREEFEEWLDQPSEPQPARSEFFLKFLFANDLPAEKILDMLKEYREYHGARLATYRAMEASLEAGLSEITPKRAVFLRAVVRSGIIAAEGMIRWCEETAAGFGKASVAEER